MQPLSGIRVLDLTRLLPGPFGSLVLSELGAQVDKIEDAGAGDYLRYSQPQRAGESVAFIALNRGKRGAVVDLKNEQGREAMLRLIGHYDVLFEQFRPGVLERLGLGHAQLRTRYPKLIICALTGYGQHGPLSQRAGHDLNYLARAGVLGAHGPADGPPQVPGFQLADVSGGMWCVIAILAALRHREQTGEGQVCDIAMTDGVLGFSALQVCGALAGEPQKRGQEVLTGGVAPYGTYASKDGAAITLASLEPKFWLAFAAANGLDPDISALLPGEHQAALKERIAAVFASKSREEWIAFGAEHDCCVEPVLALDEIAEDEHLKARGLVYDQPVGDTSVPCFRTPVSDKANLPTPPPHKGEHTRAIFAEAGFSEDEIDTLLASGAIAEG